MPNPQVTIYTDGACTGNPGPGGYGVVMLSGKNRKELSGGFRMTTNNRMEIMAAIVAMESLNKPCEVTLYSDSQYVVNAISKGWAQRWRSQGWWLKLKGGERAKNPDLWGRLLNAVEKHRVTFQWVRGHAGNAENERCDVLSVAAAKAPDLPADEMFERENPGDKEEKEESFFPDD